MDPLLSKSQPNDAARQRRGRRPTPEPSKLTVCPTSGAAGEKVKDAEGGALTVTVWETVSGTPSTSVTLSDTVLEPDAYENVGVTPSASSNWPSPSRSHA